MQNFFFYRSLILLFGMSILAFGVVLSIYSQLGTSPISSVPYTFSYFIPMTIGTLTIIMHAIFILIQKALLGKDFKAIQWLQLLMGILFGLLIDVMLYLTNGWIFENYFIQLSLSLASCVLTAIGVCLMVKANLILLAGDGLYIAFVKRFGFDLGNTKTVGDCVLVSIAAISSYIMLEKIVGIREGTIITALLVGTIIKFIRPYFDFIRFEKTEISNKTLADDVQK